MSISSLMSALSQGYNSKQIIDWLSKSGKKIGKDILRAKTQGYDDDQILSYLTKGKHASHGQKNEMLSGMTEAEKGSRIANQGTNWSQIGKGVGTVAGLGVGAFGLSKAIPAAANAAKGLFKNRGIGSQTAGASTAQSPIAGISNSSNIGPKPMSGAPITPPSVNASSPLSPQSTNQQPIVPPQPQINPEAQARKEMLENPIHSDPEFREWLKAKVSAGDDRPIAVMVNEYKKEKAANAKGSPLMQGIAQDVQKMNALTENSSKVQRIELPEGGYYEGPNFEGTREAQKLKASGKFDEFMKPYRESKSPEKGLVVSTPDGEVGTVKDIRKTEALVDEDGKLHKLKIGDIKLPNEEVQQTVARLLEMPEIDKSSIINYWAYDPEDKEVLLMFHNGETYKYLDVPEELEQELLESSVSPKTKGQNVFGAWAQDDPQSRGATFINKLIANPKYKRAGKGQEPNKYYRKLRKGYDYWQKLRK
jgi:hypothetical protein